MLDDSYAVIDDVMERIVDEQETKLAAEQDQFTQPWGAGRSRVVAWSPRSGQARP